LDSIAASIHLDSHDLTIISIYRHPGGPLSCFEYDSLFAFCRSFPYAILVGDFNAHHLEWGSERTDSEGETIISSAIDASFTCINNGMPTFLTRSNQLTSAIDLAFISPSIISLCEWNVLDDTFLVTIFLLLFLLTVLYGGKNFSPTESNIQRRLINSL